MADVVADVMADRQRWERHPRQEERHPNSPIPNPRSPIYRSPLPTLIPPHFNNDWVDKTPKINYNSLDKMTNSSGDSFPWLSKVRTQL
jgi:hypothetical protein